MKRAIYANKREPRYFTHLGIEIITLLEDTDSDKQLTYSEIAQCILQKINREVESNGLKGFPLSVWKSNLSIKSAQTDLVSAEAIETARKYLDECLGPDSKS